MSSPKKHSSISTGYDKDRKIAKRVVARLKSIFLLCIIFVSTLVTLPILQPTSVSALFPTETSGSINSTNINDPDWQVKSLLYYSTISRCMLTSNVVDNTISVSQVSAGEWFHTGGTWDKWTYNGAYLSQPFSSLPDSGGKGAMECGKISKIILDALALWRIDASTLLCNSGFKRVGLNSASLADCIKASDTSFDGDHRSKQDNYDNFTAYIKGTIYGGGDPTISNAAAYIYYRHSLNQSCLEEAKIDTTEPKYKDSQADTTGTNGKKVYTGVRWISNVGTESPNTAYINGSIDNDGLINVGETYLDNVNLEGVLSCKYIVTRMNSYADAYMIWKKQFPDVIVDPSKNTPPITDTSTCAISGIGWIVCPVVEFLAGIADGAFGFLADNFLTTSTKIFDNTSTGTSSPTYAAWSVMRDIANVAFVIVFLIIIFSQITSFGVTNYGIKKMLPRLIIAAILVNLSYFVCQIAVDLSNILGSSLQSLLAGLIPATATVPHFGATSGGGLGIAGGIIAAVGTGVIVWAALASLIPVLLASVVALIMILFILIARQALIILLIVVSPLAFVAFLLPNTEKLFKSWQKMLTAMLMLFPIIAVVFGASKLASTILSGVFNDGTTENWIGQIATAAVMILPLFVVPGLLKKALDGVGGIGAKLNGLGSKVGSALGKNVSEKSRLGQFAKYKDSETAKRRALIQSGNYAGRGGRANPRNWVSGINKGINTKMPGKFGASSAASGVSLANKMEDDEVANRTILMQSQKDYATDAIGYAESEFNAAVESGDTVRARAAQSILLNTGGPGIKRLHKSVANIRGTGKNRATINKLRTIINSSGLKGKDIGLSNWGHQKYDPASTEDPVEKVGLLAAKEDSFAKLGYDGIAMDVLEVDPKAFVGLNSTELAGQDLEFLEKGKNISGEMARAVLSNQNASQLLTKDKREFFGRRSNAEPATPTVKSSAPPTSPTTPILDQYGNPMPPSQNNRNNP